jgi:hypothetical protein
VEFTVALVAAIAIAAGLLMLNRIELSRINTIIKARTEAGELALSPLYAGSLDARFILDWEPGADEARYTQDDQASQDYLSPPLIETIVDNSGINDIDALPTNIFYRLALNPNPITEFYLVKGSESMSVDLSDIPAVRNMLTREPVIPLKSEAWLTWTEGIY